MQKQFPIFPKATAIWLIENTSLTFTQISDFCGIHELQIRAIADGEVAQSILGLDPISGGQLTKEEIARCSADKNASLVIIKNIEFEGGAKKKTLTKYTPIARRQDKPDAVFWILKNYPQILDNKIVKLIGTTKATIDSIRTRTHWNMKNIRPRDPVLLGICTQVDLDKLVQATKSPEHETAL